MVCLKTLETIHENMKKVIESQGGKIRDVFFCPHIPEDECACRKPKPGMILEAKKKYNIDLSSAFMVGDRSKDIACARNAGCAFAVLVKTGNGFYAETKLKQQKYVPDHVTNDLYDAVSWIISHDKSRAPLHSHA